MAKVYITHENSDWTEHLTQRLDELNVPYEEWFLDKGTLDLTEEPPEGVFYNRMSASSHTRDHRFAPEYTQAVLHWLESHGRKVFNGRRALELEVSKVAQYQALGVHGIRTPKTVAAVGGQDQIIQAARQFGTTPFITKHNRAGKGLGVQLFDSIAALEQYVESPEFEVPIDGMTLIQAYIESPESYITRCEFVGGQFLYAVRVDTSEGFELCPADACTIDDLNCPIDGEGSDEQFQIIENFDESIIKQYEAFLQENQITFAGIEFIRDKDGQIYTYDVNTNTNYNSDAEAKVNKYGMLEIAKYLREQLEYVTGTMI